MDGSGREKKESRRLILIEDAVPRGVEAAYRTNVAPNHKGNPLIECLPEATTETAVDSLFVVPEVPDEYRKESDQIRIDMLSTIRNFRFPLDIHEVIAYHLIQMIRDGYENRNPVKLEEKIVKRANSQNIRERKENPEVVQVTSETACLIGISGVGKTTAVLTELVNLFDQVIVHKFYHGKPFTCKQIVYLKVEAPHDGSLQYLCMNIFRAFDRALGNTLYEQDAVTKGQGTNKMVTRIAELIDQHAVGLIIIDEIQHLVRNNRVTGELVNFLTQAINEWNTPVLFIGTPEAEKLFGRRLRISRRMATKGTESWDRIHFDDPDWNILMEELFRMQFTRTKTKLTPELSRAFYDATQGIMQLVILMFQRVQFHVITDQDNEEDIIRVEDVNKTYKTDFKAVHGVVEAMKNDDFTTLRGYEDALIELDGYVAENSFAQNPSPEYKAHMKIRENLRGQKTIELYDMLAGLGILENMTPKRLQEMAREAAVFIENGEDEKEIRSDLIQNAIQENSLADQKENSGPERRGKSMKEQKVKLPEDCFADAEETF